jgi:hypothetical protein
MAGLLRPLREVAAARRHLGSAPGARADPHARTKRGAIGEAEWSASVDTTVGRAHRPSETQKGGPDPAKRGPGAQTGRLLDQAAPLLRRAGAPLSLALTAGQRNESTQLVALLEGGLPGEGRGIAPTLPERNDQPERREQRGDKPPAFEAGRLYRKRDAVEGRANRLKRWRSRRGTRSRRQTTGRLSSPPRQCSGWPPDPPDAP